MTNEEKFKTPEERIDAFKRYCAPRVCDDCQAYKIHHCPDGRMGCIVRWLSLEVEEKKPLACPFCGSVDIKVMSPVRPDYVVSSCYVVSCCNCGAVSRAEATKTDAIAAWNRRAK